MSSSTDDVPFYLMPVAAILGMYVLAGCVRLLYLVYQSLVRKTSYTPPRSTWTMLLSTVAIAAILYAKIVASVNNAMEASSHALFDPYELLELSSTTTNSTVIKQAYRSLSKLHHPDKKGGSSQKFQNIHLAYKALTDPTGMHNYQQYGHPDGPPSSTSLAFALPPWLLHPEGNIALVLIMLYLGFFVLVILYAVKFVTKNSQTKQDQNQNLVHLATLLSPDSTPLDVLYAVCTTPDNISTSLKMYNKALQLKQERFKVMEESEKKKKKSPPSNTFDSLIDGDDWAQEDDNEDNPNAAEQQEERQRKERLEELKKAQGNATVLLEGVDEGVIGQAWVERMLEQEGQWPPQDLGVLQDLVFEYEGKQVTALQHPAIRRNLCMTMGRLNSMALNSHSELLEAGSKGLVDQTYFKSTAEYRQRAIALLEAALRMAIALKSYRLAKTIVETISMFKVGTPSATDPKHVEWFNGIMKRQYNVVPSIKITNLQVETDDEDEIATGDFCTARMDVERLHAEHFTRQKVALCQKQGIPPEVALQTYREGWWAMVRAEKLDHGEWQAPPLKPNDQIANMLSSVDLSKFVSEGPQDRLLTAWPMMVQNVAQKSGKIKIQFKAPTEPGKYRFYISLKSQEFLGADVELTHDTDIVDLASVQRKEQDDDDDEAKKEK